jgi:hypothetical protein
MGECTKDTAFGIMDYFFENGLSHSLSTQVKAQVG